MFIIFMILCIASFGVMGEICSIDVHFVCGVRDSAVWFCRYVSLVKIYDAYEDNNLYLIL